MNSERLPSEESSHHYQGGHPRQHSRASDGSSSKRGHGACWMRVRLRHFSLASKKPRSRSRKSRNTNPGTRISSQFVLRELPSLQRAADVIKCKEIKAI